ncbi:MAG: hypothetical protein NC924_02850 [Candidatus Omnitrophica bacterium]|nr:hypothetical protein [Candidatus Omnitrophota bacterium]
MGWVIVLLIVFGIGYRIFCSQCASDEARQKSADLDEALDEELADFDYLDDSTRQEDR